MGLTKQNKRVNTRPDIFGGEREGEGGGGKMCSFFL